MSDKGVLILTILSSLLVLFIIKGLIDTDRLLDKNWATGLVKHICFIGNKQLSSEKYDEILRLVPRPKRGKPEHISIVVDGTLYLLTIYKAEKITIFSTQVKQPERRDLY